MLSSDKVRCFGSNGSPNAETDQLSQLTPFGGFLLYLVNNETLKVSTVEKGGKEGVFSVSKPTDSSLGQTTGPNFFAKLHRNIKPETYGSRSTVDSS